MQTAWIAGRRVKWVNCFTNSRIHVKIEGSLYVLCILILDASIAGEVWDDLILSTFIREMSTYYYSLLWIMQEGFTVVTCYLAFLGFCYGSVFEASIMLNFHQGFLYLLPWTASVAPATDLLLFYFAICTSYHVDIKEGVRVRCVWLD